MLDGREARRKERGVGHRKGDKTVGCFRKNSEVVVGRPGRISASLLSECVTCTASLILPGTVGTMQVTSPFSSGGKVVVVAVTEGGQVRLA